MARPSSGLQTTPQVPESKGCAKEKVGTLTFATIEPYLLDCQGWQRHVNLHASFLFHQPCTFRLWSFSRIPYSRRSDPREGARLSLSSESGLQPFLSLLAGDAFLFLGLECRFLLRFRGPTVGEGVERRTRTLN